MHDRDARERIEQAEEVVRLLAAAVTAVRLYPPTSPLRRAAIDRLVSATRTLPAASTLQLKVDRERFVLGGTAIASSVGGVAALAEALHALQVGQLIITPRATEAEVAVFLDALTQDPRALRASGGLREALVTAGVNGLAVIEVTLRASSEEGLAGVDLTAAPLEEIARHTQAAAQQWARHAPSGDAVDEVARALDDLEEAARDLAATRIAQALLRLDESTRARVLAAALTASADGRRMDGMLSVVARMRPAALARLLRLAAEMAHTAPDDIARTLQLPPGLLKEVLALLIPAPRSEQECGVPASPDIPGIVREVEESTEVDQMRVEELMRASTQESSARRAASAVIDLASRDPSDETITALGDAVALALKAGAFDVIEPAFACLDELERSAAAASALRVRIRLAESLFDTLPTVPARYKDGVNRVLGRAVEALIPYASRTVREGEPTAAFAAIDALASLKDRRLVSVMAQALEHLDVAVRTRAIDVLADTYPDGAAAILERALAHWDDETRRAAVRAIGRAHVQKAVPALLRILDDTYPLDRKHELKREVIGCLETMNTPQAIPTLRRIARRRFVLGKRNRELRYRAQRALAVLESEIETKGR